MLVLCSLRVCIPDEISELKHERECGESYPPTDRLHIQQPGNTHTQYSILIPVHMLTNHLQYIYYAAHICCLSHIL